MDAMDSTKVWYTSTVLEKELRKMGDTEIPHIKIGFRVMIENGNKIDANGVKFCGWSESFDESVPLYNMRIQKYKSFERTLAESYEHSVLHSLDCDDLEDFVIYPDANNSVFAVERAQFKSSLLCQFLNNFGK